MGQASEGWHFLGRLEDAPSGGRLHGQVEVRWSSQSHGTPEAGSSCGRVCCSARSSTQKNKSSCRAAHKAWVPLALCRCRLRKTGPPPALPARHQLLPPVLPDFPFKSLRSQIHCLIELFLLQGRYVTVLQHDGRLYCLDSVCFHAGGPLGLGDIEELPGGHSCLKCPW